MGRSHFYGTIPKVIRPCITIVDFIRMRICRKRGIEGITLTTYGYQAKFPGPEKVDLCYCDISSTFFWYPIWLLQPCGTLRKFREVTAWFLHVNHQSSRVWENSNIHLQFQPDSTELIPMGYNMLHPATFVILFFCLNFACYFYFLAPGNGWMGGDPILADHCRMPPLLAVIRDTWSTAGKASMRIDNSPSERNLQFVFFQLAMLDDRRVYLYPLKICCWILTLVGESPFSSPRFYHHIPPVSTWWPPDVFCWTQTSGACLSLGTPLGAGALAPGVFFFVSGAQGGQEVWKDMWDKTITNLPSGNLT